MSTRSARRHPERHEAPGVALGYLHPGEVSGRFTQSLVNLLIHDAASGRPHILQPAGGHIAMETGPRLAEARTQMCLEFLHNPALAAAEFLFMVDTDMTFQPDAVHRLVDVAERNNADVVGGLCFAGNLTGMYPTVYELDRDEHGELMVERMVDYPKDTVVHAGATGAAFILIRRSILVRMLAAFGKTPGGHSNPYPFFAESFGKDGRPWGEDIQFCLRVNALGGTLLVDTSVKTGHVKSFELSEATYEGKPG